MTEQLVYLVHARLTEEGAADERVRSHGSGYLAKINNLTLEIGAKLLALRRRGRGGVRLRSPFLKTEK